MKTLIKSLLSSGLTLAAIGLISHNDITGTVSKIQNGTFKAHNENAYRITLKGEPTNTFAAGKDRNYDIVTTSYYWGWLCATGKDTTKCKVRPANEL